MAERIRKTAFGSVNAAALERIVESFETQRLLDAVDQVDRLAEWIGDFFRKDLLGLHGMANTIINNAPKTISSDQEKFGSWQALWRWNWKKWWRTSAPPLRVSMNWPSWLPSSLRETHRKRIPNAFVFRKPVLPITRSYVNCERSFADIGEGRRPFHECLSVLDP